MLKTAVKLHFYKKYGYQRGLNIYCDIFLDKEKDIGIDRWLGGRSDRRYRNEICKRLFLHIAR